MLKKFGNLFKFDYIFVSFVIFRVLLQIFLLDNNETELLLLFADSSYYVVKNITRNIININYMCYEFTYLLLITYYRFDSFEWFLIMNRIYNEIKPDSIDEKILKSVKKLVKVFKFLNNYKIFTITSLCATIWIINYPKSIFSHRSSNSCKFCFNYYFPGFYKFIT
jgi:hypothetical protein